MTQTTIQYTPRNELHSKILKLCHQMELPLHYNHKGPKTFTNYQRVGLIILYHRSKKALRDFIAELYESLWPQWLGLKEIPGKSTLNDWMKLFQLQTIRQLQTILVSDQQPEILAIDSTGIDSWHQSRHYTWRIGMPYIPHTKLNALVDVATSVILDYTFILKPRHDVLAAKRILRRMKYHNTLILGDGAYDCEELHRIARAKKSELFAPLRKSSRTTPKGFFRKKCIERHPAYGMRNKVESTFHALKAVHVSALKSRLSLTKKREMAWQILVYNLKRIKNYWKLRMILFRTEPSLSKDIYNPHHSYHL